MKNIVTTICIALLFSIVFSSCQKDKNIAPPPSAGKILIKFINTTGQDINAAKSDNIEVGNIKAGNETGYIAFENFGVDTGMPDSKFIGNLNDTPLECSSQFLFCGAEKGKLKEGQYTIAIRTITVDDISYFDLQFKR